MAFHVDYDSVAARYDRRYLENDYSGVRELSQLLWGDVLGVYSRSAAALAIGCGC